jgi:hypothetical protein
MHIPCWSYAHNLCSRLGLLRRLPRYTCRCRGQINQQPTCLFAVYTCCEFVNSKKSFHGPRSTVTVTVTVTVFHTILEGSYFVLYSFWTVLGGIFTVHHDDTFNQTFPFHSNNQQKWQREEHLKQLYQKGQGTLTSSGAALHLRK